AEEPRPAWWPDPFAARLDCADAKGRKPRGFLQACAAQRDAGLARRRRLPGAAQERYGCEKLSDRRRNRRAVRPWLSSQARRHDLQARIRRGVIRSTTF